MHLDDEFLQLIDNLCELDQKISTSLTSNEINAAEIGQFVDNREQLLQKLLGVIKQSPELEQRPQWQEAVNRTQSIVALMQDKTSELALALQKYRHGKRSVQQYQKFL